MGFFYSHDEGVVRKNYKTAIYWFMLAAKAGITDAQVWLGYCCHYGKGTSRDDKKAVYWYKKAAKRQDQRSFYNLGLCYEDGDGVNQSIRWAKYYFQKASKLGHEKAREKLLEIGLEINYKLKN
jgi:TPR repeat protein